MSKYDPIGVIPIFEEIPQDFETQLSSMKRAYNWDVTIEAPGHTLYSEAAD